MNTYFAANEVNSSCATLEVVSLDLTSFSAIPLIFLIPSFLTHQDQERDKRPQKIPTAVVRAYIERGEHRCCCFTSGSVTGVPSRAEVRRGAKSIFFV